MEEITENTQEVKPKKKFSFKNQFPGFSQGGATLLMVMLFTFLVAGAGCIAVFFASVQGHEKVMVPNVVGKPLATAIFEMQDKALFPKIQMHYSDLPGEAGIVLEQKPVHGAIVKAYNTVTLTVSRGIATTVVGNYVGQDLDTVKAAIELEFAGERPNLTVDAPVFQKDPAPMGTILAQYPEADYSIMEPVKMRFVVSSGNSEVTTSVLDIKGKTIDQYLAELPSYKTIYEFSIRYASSDEEAGTVTSVDIPSDSVPYYSRVKAELAIAERAEDSVLVQGLFTADLAEYPYPVPMKLEAMDQEGKTTVIADFVHPGKLLTIPYEVKPESTLTLYVMDEIMTTEVIH